MTVLDHGHAVPPSYGRCTGRRHNHDVTMLPALPPSVRSARAHVTSVLHDWGLGRHGEDVTLVVSELVTNAIEAAALLSVPGSLSVCLASDAHWLMVAIADASPRFPLWLSPDDAAESGRGLAVVDALSVRWGWHPVTWPGLIKAVWAEFWISQEDCP